MIVPAALIGTGALLTWLLGERLALPESFDEVVAWLRGHGAYAWAVAGGVIVADALLPVPSAPATVALGIIYGWLAGGLLASGALMVAGLLGFGATRALGRRGARLLVGEADLARATAFYDRWGLVAVAAGRAVGGPAEWAVSWPACRACPCAGSRSRSASAACRPASSWRGSVCWPSRSRCSRWPSRWLCSRCCSWSRGT